MKKLLIKLGKARREYCDEKYKLTSENSHLVPVNFNVARDKFHSLISAVLDTATKEYEKTKKK